MADPKFDETEPVSFEETEAIAAAPSFEDTEPEEVSNEGTARVAGAFQDLTLGFFIIIFTCYR